MVGGSIWSFGPFELDEHRYVLRRGDEEVELRPKVFDVLRYLIAHRERVVGKAELLAELWPGETISESVLPQNVTALRKVLGDHRSEARMIQTVHGRGYRFVAEVAERRAEAADPPTASSPMTAPFIGRERVMGELHGLLEESIAGHGRFALITGEAGIGKTRTAEQLATIARERGARVLIGRCHEGEGTPPYWPWVQILRTAVAEADQALLPSQLGARAGDVAHLVGELRERFGAPQPLQASDSEEARFRLFDSVTTFLSELARERPLVLILDDLHWADEATLLLLRFLARELRALPLLLLSTSREVDSRGASPTASLLSSLAGETHARRVYLQGLSRTQVGELAAALTRELDPPLLQELYRLSAGNPFFVKEVARLLDAEATSRGDWHLELPARVREVVGLRAQAVSEQTRRVLTVAAVIGNDFGMGVLEAVCGLPRPDLLSKIDEAIAARIVERASEDGQSGHYRFSHALIRESLYGAIAETERVALHARVGEAMERLLGVEVDDHLPELAHHALQAAPGGNVERAVSCCVRAAEKAIELLAFEQGAAHYRRALDALATRLPVDEQRRFELKLALGATLFRAGEDGNPALLEAAKVARRLGRPDLLARTVLTMDGWPRVTRHGRTANRELYPLLTEALEGLTDPDPALHARLLSVLALNCPREATLADKVALSRQALELARSSGQDTALYDALHARLVLMQSPEDTSQRLGLASELLTVAERLGERYRVFRAHEARVAPLIALGDMASADREVEACALLSEQLRLPRCELEVLRFRLQRALGDGRFHEVGPLTQQAVRVRGQARQSGLYVASMYVWAMFAVAWRGDRKLLLQGMDEVARMSDGEGMMRSHVAYLYAVVEDYTRAREYYGILLEPRVLERERDDNWLTTRMLTAEAASMCGDREAAAILYPLLLPHAALNVSHPELRVYLGSGSHHLGLLAALLGERKAAADHFERALEMNAALGARPALARTSVEYARVLLGRAGGAGHTPSAARARARTLLTEAAELARATQMQGLLQSIKALQD